MNLFSVVNKLAAYLILTLKYIDMNKLHSRLIALVLFGLLSPFLTAQESETGKIKELYLNGNPLTFSNFGLQYKKEIKNGNFLRIGLTNLFSQISKQDFGSASTFPTANTHLEGSFEVGIEKRNKINNRLTAFYGINFVAASSFYRQKTENPSLLRDLRHLDILSINPGFGFNSGFILSISDEFAIAAEVVPQLLYNYSTTQRIAGTDKITDTTQGGSFNFNNQSLRVSIIYKWIKN